MELNFSYIASSLTTEELNDRIINRKNYMPETVEAAVAELKYRKHEFSADELSTINADIELQRRNSAAVDSRRGFFNSNTKKVIVKDPEAPLFYSRQAVYIFTVLCGALFGSILLAINVGKTQKSNNAVWVVLFGVVFTALQIFIAQVAVPHSSGSYAILWGLVAAAILDAFFWKQFIGYPTFYRARPIWVPLIIALVVFGLLIALIIGGQAR